METRYPNGRPRRPVADRFWEKVDTSGGPDACWPWLGVVGLTGYGVFRVAKSIPNQIAHRMAYLVAYGPVAPGQPIDHLCHTNDRTCFKGNACPHRRCVNPRHLEPVSFLENARRGRREDKATEPVGGRTNFAFSADVDVLVRMEKWAKANQISRGEAARRVFERAFPPT